MDFLARFGRRRQPAIARYGRAAVAGLLAVTFAASYSVLAAEGGETVLIRRGDAAITRADLDHELRRLPEDARVTLVNSERHVIELLDRLLVARELAAKARGRKLDADLKLEGLSTLEQERMLAAAWIASVDDAAGRDFDATRDAWERRAREIYVSDRPRYTIPERVVATQIFFAADRGGPDEARKRAFAAAARLEGGADFTALALAVSDEPNVAETRGRIGPVERDRLPPSISAAVFALKQPGDVTAPLEAPVGWYLFRLDARRPGHVQPFDEVRAAILAGLREREQERARNGVYGDLRANSRDVTVNEPALRALNTAPDPARSPPQAAGLQSAPAPK
jgi:peptidyl-prolyl cis-trans isomerase C